MKLSTWIQTATLLVVLATLHSARAADESAIPRWQPHDFHFTASGQMTNPFQVAFSAVIHGPGGKVFELPGFFAGDDTWVIRVSPTMRGRWSLVTRSDLPALDGKTTHFTCVAKRNPKIHGVLRVDREHPHHFIFDDGTHFFMQGYEYDWLWALDMDQPNVPTVDKTLDLISRYGFDCVILNSYAYDTSWRKGTTGPDDYGPPRLYPWAGSNAHPIQSRMNLAYWRHYDLVMDALYERGIEAHLFIKVYNKMVHWPARGSADEELFFRWLIARYAAYPNLIWDFSKEAQNEKDLAYKQRCLKFFRNHDPYHHLVTIHDDDAANARGAYDTLTDFRSDQQHSNFRETILRQRQRHPWPVVNVESDYECGPDGLADKTYGVAQTATQTVRTLWQIAMAGGYTVYYYTYTAWDVIRPLDVPPGYALMKHFGDFWRATEYWRLHPADKLVSAGWCLADTGREYVVYCEKAMPFTLTIQDAPRKLTAAWFNPFTGKTTAAGSYGQGTTRFTPPQDWGSAPLVLHLSQGTHRRSE